jgi:putative membrane protein insertion efficiency factor
MTEMPISPSQTDPTTRGGPTRISLAARAALIPVRLYQLLISPMLGPRCRFAPSCSEYAADALKTHGALKGTFLAARRISRCHPLGGSGYDPVPPAASTPSVTSPKDL